MLRNTLFSQTEEQQIAKQLYNCMVELFPICRSISGEGVRETLNHLRQVIPLEIKEVPSGTDVFDWQVPKEWNITDAYVKDAQGKRVIDFQQSNLHVVNYSVPYRGTLSLEELKAHLFTLPEQPDLIPYRTSYYKESWGFCLSQNQLDGLVEGEYDVCIDSSLKQGSLTYGELIIPGSCEEEILISCHVCHPSLANDNLSGVVISAYLAKFLQTLPLRYSYRFLFIPGTIGAITWLAQNESVIPNIKHGLVLAGLGDSGCLTYKRSRRNDSTIDMAAAYSLQQLGEHELFDFSPYGYDERQFCSPGFNLPVGRLSRTPYGSFPEYHTSGDNLDFVKPLQLVKSLAACADILDIVEHNRVYLNTKPYGEPRLSKYGLYSEIGGMKESAESQMALLWVLNLCDGDHNLLDIAQRSELPFSDIVLAAEALHKSGLLKDLT